jgi:hypothetical protein
MCRVRRTMIGNLCFPLHHQDNTHLQLSTSIGNHYNQTSSLDMSLYMFVVVDVV